jgi:hypothetical protein
MKRKFKIVLSWLVVASGVFLIGNLIFEFLKAFNYPWAYGLVVLTLSYFGYRFIGE